MEKSLSMSLQTKTKCLDNFQSLSKALGSMEITYIANFTSFFLNSVNRIPISDQLFTNVAMLNTSTGRCDVFVC